MPHLISNFDHIRDAVARIKCEQLTTIHSALRDHQSELSYVVCTQVSEFVDNDFESHEGHDFAELQSTGEVKLIWQNKK
jgi:hypothetical protein